MSRRNDFAAFQEIRNWNVDTVVKLLEKNGLGECAGAVRKRGITGDSLLDLTEIKLAIWKVDMNLGNIRKLAAFVQELNRDPSQYLLAENESCEPLLSERQPRGKKDGPNPASLKGLLPTRSGSSSSRSSHSSWGSDFDDDPEDGHNGKENGVRKLMGRPESSTPTPQPRPSVTKLTIPDVFSQKPAITAAKPKFPCKPQPSVPIVPRPTPGHLGVKSTPSVPNLPRSAAGGQSAPNVPSVPRPAAGGQNAPNVPSLPRPAAGGQSAPNVPSLPRPAAGGQNVPNVPNLPRRPDKLSSPAQPPRMEAPPSRPLLPMRPPGMAQDKPILPKPPPSMQEKLICNLNLDMAEDEFYDSLDGDSFPEEGMRPNISNILQEGKTSPNIVGSHLESKTSLSVMTPRLEGRTSPNLTVGDIPTGADPAAGVPKIKASIANLGTRLPFPSMGPKLPPPNPAPAQDECEEEYEVCERRPSEDSYEEEEEYASIREQDGREVPDGFDYYLQPVSNPAPMSLRKMTPPAAPSPEPGIRPPPLPTKPRPVLPDVVSYPSVRAPSPPKTKSEDSGSSGDGVTGRIGGLFRKNKREVKEKTPTPEIKKAVTPPVPNHKPPPPPPVEQRPTPVSTTQGRPLPQPPVSDKTSGGQRRSDPHTPITSMPWYHNVDRRKGEAMLRNREDGTFMIRPSTQIKNPLTLTLWYNGRVYHISVRQRPDGRYALGSEKCNEQSFVSLEEMVDNYQSEKLVLYSGGEQTGTTLLTTTPRKEPK